MMTTNNGYAFDDLMARAAAYEAGQGNPGMYSSTDSDGDNLPDWLEDDNLNSTPNFLDPTSAYYYDSDDDGLVDLFDRNSGGAPSNTPDNSGNGEFDFRDGKYTNRIANYACFF